MDPKDDNHDDGYLTDEEAEAEYGEPYFPPEMSGVAGYPNFIPGVNHHWGTNSTQIRRGIRPR